MRFILTFELEVDPVEWEKCFGVAVADVAADVEDYFIGSQPYNGDLAHGAVCTEVTVKS